MSNPSTTPIALYLRLSSEDMLAGESNSIKSQRELLNQYLDNNPELFAHQRLEFCDDGYSGTNFKRPAVEDLLDKVKSCEIKHIIVKDFSRWGRSYIEVGSYLEQIFPFYGVRFISVNDNFDSNTKEADDMDIALKSLINDLYSKDQSIKCKTALNAKKSRGEFAGSVPVYGYKKSITNKNQLVVDEVAADVVRRIFTYAIEGKRAREIAAILNQEVIPTRGSYKTRSLNRKGATHVSKIGAFWKESCIREVIDHECYTGTAVANKTVKISVGGSEVPVPRENWTRVENAHPAIVSREEYKAAQKLLIPLPRRKAPVAPNLFKNKVRCSHCGYVLKRNKGQKPSYVCNTPLTMPSAKCVVDNVSEADIEKAVLLAIQSNVEQNCFKSDSSTIPISDDPTIPTSDDLTILVDEVECSGVQDNQPRPQPQMQSQPPHTPQPSQRASKKTSEERNALEKQLEKLNAAKQDRYESYKDGNLTKEEYLSLRTELNWQIEALNKKVSRLSQQLSGDALSHQRNQKQMSSSITTLTQELVNEFLHAVMINGKGKIKIELNGSTDAKKSEKII
ncbi:MAG: recombinase family protein [Defluviitaleaceae bacterium]|nr:recombinase family protein [Defluviitaleaceae bacterium]